MKDNRYAVVEYDYEEAPNEYTLQDFLNGLYGYEDYNLVSVVDRPEKKCMWLVFQKKTAV